MPPAITDGQVTRFFHEPRQPGHGRSGRSPAV